MIYYFLRKPEWKTFNPWLVYICVWTFSVYSFMVLHLREYRFFDAWNIFKRVGLHLGFCWIIQNDFNLHLLETYKQWISKLNIRAQKGNPSGQWLLRIKEYLCHFGELLQFFLHFKTSQELRMLSRSLSVC